MLRFRVVSCSSLVDAAGEVLFESDDRAEAEREAKVRSDASGQRQGFAVEVFGQMEGYRNAVWRRYLYVRTESERKRLKADELAGLQEKFRLLRIAQEEKRLQSRRGKKDGAARAKGDDLVRR